MEEAEQNRQAQEDEKLALTSIYSEDFFKEMATGDDKEGAFVVRFSVTLSEEEGVLPPTTVVVTIHLPPTYPRSDPPVYAIEEAYGEPSWITNNHRAFVRDELQAMYDAGEHGVVLFQWIEWLRGWLENTWREHLDQHAELVWRFQSEQQQKEEAATSSMPHQGQTLVYNTIEGEADLLANNEVLIAAVEADLPPVYHSKEPLVDRRSVFVAHVAPVQSVEDVQRVKRYLLSNPKIAKATHNILAYRIVQPRNIRGKHSVDGELTISDCDDDGESAAGGRLLHLLDVCKCRNVVVVVSRWYGGIHLGPDRFKHINNVARELLHAYGFIP